MIKYSLECDKDHLFEAWFGSSEDFDKQRKRGLIQCPSCGSNKVSKSLMAPRVTGTKKDKRESVPMAQMPAPQLPAEMVEQLRKIKKHVEENAENVGDKFPEEARKIHYGESEARGIYGEANREEVESLLDEGVAIAPLPPVPDDVN